MMVFIFSFLPSPISSSSSKISRDFDSGAFDDFFISPQNDAPDLLLGNSGEAAGQSWPIGDRDFAAQAPDVPKF